MNRIVVPWLVLGLVSASSAQSPRPPTVIEVEVDPQNVLLTSSLRLEDVQAIRQAVTDLLDKTPYLRAPATEERARATLKLTLRRAGSGLYFVDFTVELEDPAEGTVGVFEDVLRLGLWEDDPSPSLTAISSEVRNCFEQLCSVDQDQFVEHIASRIPLYVHARTESPTSAYWGSSYFVLPVAGLVLERELRARYYVWLGESTAQSSFDWSGPLADRTEDGEIKRVPAALGECLPKGPGLASPEERMVLCLPRPLPTGLQEFIDSYRSPLGIVNDLRVIPAQLTRVSLHRIVPAGTEALTRSPSKTGLE